MALAFMRTRVSRNYHSLFTLWICIFAYINDPYCLPHSALAFTNRVLEKELSMSTTRGQHLIGKVLGSCLLEKLLGYGGSSAVFLAQQPERKVAVKVFLHRSTMDAQMRKDFYQRFLREAQAASQLDHPNILPIYSYGEQDGIPYIVMPYMSGGTLSEYVTRHGSLSLQDVQWYLEQIASALDYAHSHGCIHCDVKPANILIDGEGHVMLSDFGIAHLSKDGNTTSPGRKNPDALMGTPDYISPEQAMGYSMDGRSDIYSLGVTAFYLLAKQLPFKSDSSIALALMHVHDAPPSLVSMRVDVSSALDQVVHTALAKKPDERFQTATGFSMAFAEAVTQVLLTNEQAMVNGKYPLLGCNPGYLGRIFPSLAVADPVMADKSAGRRLKTARLVGATSLLLLVTLIIVFSMNYLIMQFAGRPSDTRNTSMVTMNSVRASADLLVDHHDWPTSPTLFFDQPEQRYHIFNKSPVPLISLFQGDTYGDFQLSVTMEEMRGPNNNCYYGVVFRSASDQSKYYLFEVLTSGIDQYGKYDFWRYDGAWTKNSLISSGDAPALLTDPGKSNTLAVKAQGNHFSFNINQKALGQPVTDTSKSALKLGQIGLYVETQGSEIAFSHLYVKSLK
jgi:tRNA A-37 threonylcarbamoyl transferase component Bud32